LHSRRACAAPPAVHCLRTPLPPTPWPPASFAIARSCVSHVIALHRATTDSQRAPEAPERPVTNEKHLVRVRSKFDRFEDLGTGLEIVRQTLFGARRLYVCLSTPGWVDDGGKHPSSTHPGVHMRTYLCVYQRHGDGRCACVPACMSLRAR